MNLPRTIRCSRPLGFISAKAAIVLAVITGAGGMLTYEWHHAHSAKGHYARSATHHKRHGAKTDATH
jgi:hypothetical protein